MRITLTGASGVGKTTLAQHLSEKLNLPLIPELGREICKEMGFERIGDIPDQEKFKVQVLARQIELEEHLQHFIADRSAIDCWVLWQRWNLCSAMTYDTERYYNHAREQSLKYTHIIYVPPHFKTVEDGFRWTDPDYITQLDRIVRMTLFDMNLWSKTLTISSDKIEARIEEVTGWISEQT